MDLAAVLTEGLLGLPIAPHFNYPYHAISGDPLLGSGQSLWAAFTQPCNAEVEDVQPCFSPWALRAVR
jgi:hypothetical protein